MNCIISILLVLCLTSWSYAGHGMVPGMGIMAYTSTSCGTSFEVCSNFDNLTGWTQDVGTWSASGTLTKTAGDDCILRYSATALANSYRQYAKLKVSTYDVGSGSYPYLGLIFRSGSSTGYRYGIYFHSASTNAAFHYYNWNTYGAIIGSDKGPPPVTLASGMWVGAEVENTGTDTLFSAWTWASDPGARSNWGAANLTWTDDPAQVANTEVYVGILMATDSDSLLTALDDWYAGSSASAP